MNMRKKLAGPQVALLRSVPAFRTCSDRELEEVARLVDEASIPEGQTIITEGSMARQAFVILEGWAAVTVHGEPIAALGPGQFVGELAMLDHGPRTATVVAKTPMRLLVIGPAAFGAFSREPSIGARLAEGLAGRLRDADAKLVPSAQEREGNAR